MRFLIAAATAATIFTVAPASAAVFYGFGFSTNQVHDLQANSGTVSTSNAGWFNSNGFHDSGNQNYIVGTIDSTSYRNFFVFQAAGGASSLTLKIAAPYSWEFGGNTSLTYTLYDASPAINSFQTYTGATGIYNDLGTGTVYGQATYSSTPGVVSIVLNQAAIDAYNAAGDGAQAFAIGGALSAGAVPEPANWAMLIAGFGLVGAAARRRNAALAAH